MLFVTSVKVSESPSQNLHSDVTVEVFNNSVYRLYYTCTATMDSGPDYGPESGHSCHFKGLRITCIQLVLSIDGSQMTMV